jgi:hydrogenase maturation factor
MIKRAILLISCLMPVSQYALASEQVNAKTVFLGVARRADIVMRKTDGINNYHALLARGMAIASLDEKRQNDLPAAWLFMDLAEANADMAGKQP